jgi:hypothetical protein
MTKEVRRRSWRGAVSEVELQQSNLSLNIVKLYILTLGDSGVRLQTAARCTVT